ncbi:ABC transporter ATP-binding protein [Kitasatospora viridis]|uniref:ATP-binding cassette subfamily C protein n=1 Tax=Kitasatospora viridis TaxID=281105 RepID=A0A561ULQ0_9ACTN|nr:ATP-binding cassette subfamily C protein [Kitasatospora viridis]
MSPQPEHRERLADAPTLHLTLPRSAPTPAPNGPDASPQADKSPNPHLPPAPTLSPSPSPSTPHPLRHLLPHLRAARPAVVRVLAWSMVEALPPLLSGLLLATAADRGFLAGRPLTGCAWLGVLGVALLLRGWAARAAFPAVADVVEPMRDRLVRQVVESALARPTADPAEVARLTEQVETVRQLTATLLRTLRGIGVSLVGAVLGLALLAPAVLPLVLAPLALAALLFARLLRPVLARWQAVVLADERVAADAGSALAGLRDVAAAGSQRRVAVWVGEAFGAQLTATRALARTTALRSLTIALGGRLPVLLVLVAAPWLVRHHQLTAGQVIGVLAYLTQQLEPAIRTLSGAVGGWLPQLAVTLDRLSTTTTLTPIPAPTLAPAPTPPPTPHLRTTALRYTHPHAAAPVLTDLTLDIPPGGHLAVVGASGTGKSTLAALLAGLLTPEGGEIRLGDARPDQLPPPARAALVALVPQQAYVFTGTVRENLDWLNPGWLNPRQPNPGRPNPAGPSTPSTRTLLDAIELLGATDLVDRLGGLDAELPDPATALSAGERQLLALVRTYLSPAPVVILDEATCHLDPAAEARAEAAFADRPGTLIVIAHRLASALRADRVLLLDHGRAITARHGDLQVLSPFYRELVGHWLTAQSASSASGCAERPVRTDQPTPHQHVVRVAPADEELLRADALHHEAAPLVEAPGGSVVPEHP